MKTYSPLEPWINELSGVIIDAAYDVHTRLGPGMLESVYEKCMCIALEKRGVAHERQKRISLEYDGMRIEDAFRIDLIVENAIVIELKTVEVVLPLHEAQLLTYLRLTSYRLGLLINFNVPRIRDGIRRMIL
jgi:GxxExxY protein